MYISLCGVDPQYKLPVSTLERLSHPVSQTGPFVVVGPTVPAQQKSSFLAITFEQNIIGEIHESKTFEMSFDICQYLAFASQIDGVDVRARTDIQTHKTTTVTLAAHAHRGLTSPSRDLHVKHTHSCVMFVTMRKNSCWFLQFLH